MTVSYIDQNNTVQQLNIEVLVKNDRVVLCRVSSNCSGPYYLHYHSLAGWKDLDHGETFLSKQMHRIVENPFNIFN